MVSYGSRYTALKALALISYYSGANCRDLNSLVFEFERLSGGIAKIDLMLSVWLMSLLLLFARCC